MWYQIPNHVNENHKGWNISIGKASKWNKHLRVTITPAIAFNPHVMQTLSNEVKIKLVKLSFELSEKHQYSFEVANLYPLIYPWGEATSKARQYIDNKLGRFDLEGKIKEMGI